MASKNINDPPGLTPIHLEVLFEKNRKGVYDWQAKHRRNVIGYTQSLRYLQGKFLTIRERILANGFACNQAGEKDCISPCSFDVYCPFHIHYTGRYRTSHTKNGHRIGGSKEHMASMRLARSRTAALGNSNVKNGNTPKIVGRKEKVV